MVRAPFISLLVDRERIDWVAIANRNVTTDWVKSVYGTAAPSHVPMYFLCELFAGVHATRDANVSSLQ